MNIIKKQNGFTLLELLIAIMLTSIVSYAVMKVYINQHKTYMVQDDITDIQQNVRASIDELSKNIRMAGYDLPVGLQAIYASNTNPDTIMVAYHDRGCETFLSAPMPQPSAELKCGSDISCFEDGQWVFIYDADSAKGEWFEITEVQSAAYHLQHNNMSLSRKYGTNSIILSLTTVKYFIDNTTDPSHPKLMRQYFGEDPHVFAENIADLQFRYQMKNGAVEDEPVLTENIREVMIDIAGRSNTPEVDDDGTEFYRNRLFATSVFLRNIGI